MRGLVVLLLALFFGLQGLAQAKQPYCPVAAAYFNASDIENALEEYVTCRQDYLDKEDFAAYLHCYWMVLDCISKKQETRTLLDELNGLREMNAIVPDSLKADNAHVIKQFEFLFNRMSADLGAAAELQIAILDSLASLPGPPDEARRTRIFKSLMYLSEACLDQGRYRQALYYANMAIDTGQAIYHRAAADGFILTPHYVLVRTYTLTEDYAGAMSELNRILSIIPDVSQRQSERRINAFIDLGRLHLHSGSPDSVAFYLRELDKEPAARQFNVEIKQLQGEYLTSGNHIDEAVSCYTSLADSLEAVGNYNAEILAEVYTDLGAVLLLKNNALDAALINFHKAICTLSAIDSLPDPMSNPRLDDLFDKTTLVTALNGKAMALDRLADGSSDSEDQKMYRNAAWQTIDLGLSFVSRTRSAYRTAEDRAKLIEESYLMYQTAIDHCFTLVEEARPTWIDTAFALMESSKALNLLDDLTHKEARELAGIPDSLIRLELALIADINQLKKRERVLRKNPIENDSALRSNYGRVQRAESTYDSLLATFAEAFPSYRRASQKSRAITLDEARSALKPDETVLEYFIAGESRPYLLKYDRDGSNLIRCRDMPSVKQEIGTVATAFGEVLNDAELTVSDSELLGALFDLYQWLVAPAGDLKQHVIIVPDGILSSFPFSAFLTREPGQTHDLRDQPYFVNDHSTLYSYSSTIHYKLRNVGQRNSTRSYAFAPSIDSASGFTPLAFGSVEANQVGELLDASVIDGPVCSASAVKDLLRQEKNFGVLHFATHGLADPEHGSDSFLQFSGHTDSSRLFAYDLYNMDIDATLIYLSACQTAWGSQQAGEGVISLARAFFRSGARNLVTTVRNVGDRQAVEITDVFYDHLLDGKRVDQSLAEAQNAYIASLDNEERFLAHPAYWSGFVALGDATPLYRESGWWIWLIGALGLIALLVLFQKNRIRR